jgi:hypothetical protein
MTVLFLHIDKTGGMTIREILAAQFRRGEIRPVPHDSRTKTQPATYPVTDGDLMRHNCLFRNEGHALVMGHWDWGIVRHYHKPVILTMLREPVSRFASLYRYICNEPALYGSLSHVARQVGMMGFAKEYQRLYANAMTAQLAGVRWSGDGVVNWSVFQAALGNLGCCKWVGIYEQFDQSVERLGHVLKIEIDHIPHVNRTASSGEVDPAVAAFIRKVCAYDVALYEKGLQYGT